MDYQILLDVQSGKRRLVELPRIRLTHLLRFYLDILPRIVAELSFMIGKLYDAAFTLKNAADSPHSLMPNRVLEVEGDRAAKRNRIGDLFHLAIALLHHPACLLYINEILINTTV